MATTSAFWAVLLALVGRWHTLLVAVSWQLAALALLAWLAERALRLRSPRVRHALWWVVLVAPLLLAPGREALQRRQAVLRVPAPAAARVVALASSPRVPPVLVPRLMIEPIYPAATPPRARPYLGLSHWLALLWLLGMAGLALRLSVGHRRVRGLLARSRPVEEAPVRELFASLCAQAGVRGEVSLHSSPDLGSPVLYGWRRPIVLLPEGWLGALSVEELRAMLAHEVAHVRRGDYLANSLQRLLELPVFFHPAAWLASRRIALAREELCDAWALGVGTEAASYARSLASAAARAQGALAPVSLGLAEDRFTLLRRVEAVLARDRLRRMSRPLLVAIALLGLLAAAAFAAVEVSGPSPAPTGPVQGIGAQARRMEAELKSLALAVLMSVQDSGGQFPQATSFGELRKMLDPYLGSHLELKDTIRYLLPPGVRVGAIETPTMTPMLIIDDTPAHPTLAVVAFADGHVEDAARGPGANKSFAVDLTVLQENGQPAAGAVVRSLIRGAGGRTDQAGRLFGVEIEGDDVAFSIVSADGRESAVPAVMLMGMKAEKRVALHRPGGPADMVRLSGRVLDPAGRPVDDADLWVRAYGSGPEQQAVFLSRELGTSDAQGRFSVAVPRLTVGHLMYGGGWTDPWRCQVLAHKAGLGVGWVEAEGRATLEGLQITLSRPARLYGQVLDAEGQLLSNVTVQLAALQDPRGAVQSLALATEPPWATTRTDKRGRFALTDLPADGTVKLDISTCGAGACYREGEIAPELGVIRLAASRGELVVKLRKQPVLEGLLLTPDHKPAEGVKVWLFGSMAAQKNAVTSQSAVTDKAGHYALPMTVAGTWTVWVSDTKYFAVLLKAREVDLGQHVVIPTAVLQRSASISGRVLDARTGAPMAGVPVMCNPVGPSPVPEIPSTEDGVMTGLDGRFTIGGPPGKVVLHFGDPPAGYTWSYLAKQETVGGEPHVNVTEHPQKPSTRVLAVRPGQALTDVDLFVMPEATVAGEVFGPDGRPWHGEGYDRGGYVQGDLDRTRVTSTTYPPLGTLLKPDGTFRMRYFYGGVPATLLVVDAPDGIGGAARVTPEAGATSHVVLHLTPLARVTGRVLMPDGSPAAGAYLGVGGEGGVATTDQSGRFTATRGVVGLPTTAWAYLPAPSYRPGQSSTPPKYRGESRQFEVQPGQASVDVGDIALKPNQPKPAG